MWKIRKFASLEAQNLWVSANAGKYQITVLFVNNGFAVEYRRLRVVY